MVNVCTLGLLFWSNRLYHAPYVLRVIGFEKDSINGLNGMQFFSWWKVGIEKSYYDLYLVFPVYISKEKNY